MHAVARQDVFLTVEREMVAILADRDLRQQPRPSNTFLNRRERSIGLRHLPFAAVGARVHRPHRLLVVDRRRHVLQAVRAFLANHDLVLATLRARLFVFGNVEPHLFDRQVIGDRPATVRCNLLSLFDGSRLRICLWLGLFRLQHLGHRCEQFLFAEQPRPVEIDPVGALPVPMPQMLFELLLQPLDQRILL